MGTLGKLREGRAQGHGEDEGDDTVGERATRSRGEISYSNTAGLGVGGPTLFTKYGHAISDTRCCGSFSYAATREVQETDSYQRVIDK